MGETLVCDEAPLLARRFRIVECLGHGSTGTVYRAYDVARGAEVAVKVLTRLDPTALYRFKSEFRELSNLRHPHLLGLYDLVADEGTWLLSMQLIEGGDFLSYVRPPAEGAPANDNVAESAPSHAHAFATATLHGSAPDAAELSTAGARGLGALDVLRLRRALLGLADGLHALHQTRRLHRDLKPANVLVGRADGHLVLCDFGLVVGSDDALRPAGGSMPEPQPATYDTDGHVVGTLAYMAPEQALGQALTSAADWYAVGVMLYEALTGQLPHAVNGTLSEIVARRCSEPPPDPRRMDASLPPELCSLALALLDREPARRPGYITIRSLLAADHAAEVAEPIRLRAPLVGRDAELGALREAQARAANGHASVAFVSGRSGMGKSALVRAFLAELRAAHGVTVLGARCYEREQIPFKALDPWVDALASHLLTVDALTLPSLIPDDVGTLLPIFPTLERVPAIQVAAMRETSELPLDALERRGRAFRALRELLRRTARHTPVAIVIDDLQWGDEESGQAFAEILREPGAPALLVLLAHRSEDDRRAGLLATLRDQIVPDSGVLTPTAVALGPLARADAEGLAQALLGAHPSAARLAAQVAQESEGSPFFVGELCRHLRTLPDLSEQAIALEAVLRARRDALSPAAAQLLAMVAAAGRPERRDVLHAAAGLAGLADAERELLTESFVQSNGPDPRDRLEPYHDRIREAAYGALSPDTARRAHAALARALVAVGDNDAERLYAHHRAAGEDTEAYTQALIAAERAEQALAFERAAQLLEAALEYEIAQGEERRALVERRGHALTFAGKGPEAAEALFAAAAGAPDGRGVTLRSIGIAQLFRAGLVDRGYDEIERMRHIVRMPAPRSLVRALWMLLWRRLAIALLSGTPKHIARRTPTAEQRERLDLLWGIASCLIVIDPLRGAVYQAEHVLCARRWGDFYRMARAACLEIGFYAADNGAPGRTRWAIDRALALSGASGDMHALSVSRGTRASACMLEGRLREAVWHAREAHAANRLFRAELWDDSIISFFELTSLAMMGRIGEIMERIPEHVRDADRRGDTYAAVTGRISHFCYAYLGSDQPGRALREVEHAERLWQLRDYGFVNLSITMARAEVALYEADHGAIDAARARLDREWKRGTMVRALTQFSRSEALFLRARLALATAAHGAEEARLSRAARDARELEREGAPWLVAHARLLDGAVAAFSTPREAAALLAEAEGRFQVVDMELAAAACCVRRGQLTPGAEGAELVARGAARIRQLGAHKPGKFVRILAPGFPRVSHRLPDG